MSASGSSSSANAEELLSIYSTHRTKLCTQVHGTAAKPPSTKNGAANKQQLLTFYA
jgi:hypothetical protein